MNRTENAAARRARKRTRIAKGILTGIAVFLLSVIAIAFLLPTVLTITNSFMTSTELASNYGKVFSNLSGSGNYTYISETVTLKFIPDRVSVSQYLTTFVKSSDYLIKFWNSVILVVPITIFQIVVAMGASYCFARFRGRLREITFFIYVILMLMPYQVTLVPNYLVSSWLGILDTRWAIILPGIFSPFSVFILTKFMRRIPSALVEAAQLDGAGELRIFGSIYVPLCRGTIYSVAILVFIDYWNMVEQPLVLMRDSELHPLSVFLSKINTGDVGIAFAVATVYMIPTLLMFLYSEDYLIEGISYAGGIKG